MQNRGYATLGRIAEYADRLSENDESNAIVDALDAVNLMTVHAAKGLEFPIVFLVNVSRGTGGIGQPIRVSTDADTDAAVTIGSLRAESDEDEPLKEREETKRLLYVALTRARERFYVAGVTKDNELKPAPGSLATVFPTGFRQLFAAAVSSADDAIPWTSNGGTSHTFRVYRPNSESPVWRRMSAVRGPTSSRGDEESSIPPDDFAPLPLTTRGGPVSVTERVSTALDPECAPRSGDGTSDRLTGILVHRLFAADLPHRDDGGVSDWTARAVSGAPAADVERAERMSRALRSREDVSSLLRSGKTLYEVPFSMWTDARDGEEPVLVRGTIDCLIERSALDVVVLEVKTGRPLPWHEAQLATYVEAVRRMYPSAAVDGRVVYAEEGQRATGDIAQ